MGKVKAKLAIDRFIFHLTASGDYERLKYFAENGYLSINVINSFGKSCRDLAIERYHMNIVKLIDRIEMQQKKIKRKMNYH
jgi:hypothetical protein